jgi:hypothetical protein
MTDALARKSFLDRLMQNRTVEHLEAEAIFKSVDEMVKWIQTTANIRLRNRLVWFLIFSFTFEGALVLLHSMKLIDLPYPAVLAVAGSMGGSALGLGGLLFMIAKDLYPGKAS